MQYQSNTNNTINWNYLVYVIILISVNTYVIVETSVEQSLLIFSILRRDVSWRHSDFLQSNNVLKKQTFLRQIHFTTVFWFAIKLCMWIVLRGAKLTYLQRHWSWRRRRPISAEFVHRPIAMTSRLRWRHASLHRLSQLYYFNQPHCQHATI